MIEISVGKHCNFLQLFIQVKEHYRGKKQTVYFRRFSTYRGAKREGDSYLNNSNEFKLNPPSKNELIHDWYASIFIRMSKSHFDRTKSVEIKIHKIFMQHGILLKGSKGFPS